MGVSPIGNIGGVGGGGGRTFVFPSAPTAGDDSSAGFLVGDHWIDSSVSPAQTYVATDVSVGAAVWQVVSSFDELATHIADTTNPHSVTVAQTGGDTAGTPRPPTAHKDDHKSGGSDAFVAADILEATVKRLQTTTGPTTLLMGAVADGEFLKRSGTSIIGDTPSSTDNDAIHDNVAAEISAIADKLVPVDADHLLIEDSADADNKKDVLIGNIKQSRWRDHLTPANIAANQDDYDPGNANVYRLNPTGGDRDITGFAPTGGNSNGGRGRVITIWNINASNDIKLMHQNAGSAAANRILASGGSDITVASNEKCTLWYDPDTLRWRTSTGEGDA